MSSIPVDLFLEHRAVAVNAFRQTFRFCANLTSVPVDLFRYATLASTTSFNYCFNGCSNLATVPVGLFKYNSLSNGSNFTGAFQDNVKLKLDSQMFYLSGEQTTRFVGAGAQDFGSAFSRSSFSGVQGTAPDLWNCDYGETITLSLAPAADWAPGDTITGQTSAATAVVVSKVSGLVYKIKQHFGTFALAEIVGVTGTPTKLALQGGANPTFVGTPGSAACFGGAGNSLTSLTNYASIPASWR
jgi:hypothetical protein